MARFAITLTNPAINSDGLLDNPVMTSVRESRAKRHARKLVSGGQRNVILWRIDGATRRPIKFRASTEKPRYQSADGCNSTHIGIPVLRPKDWVATRRRPANA